MPANQYQRALAAHPDVLAYAGGPVHLASFPGVPTALLQEAINLRLFRGLIGREPVRAELDWMLSTWAGDPNVTRFLIACFGTLQYQARGTTPRHDVEFLGSGLAGVALERDYVDRLVDDIAPRWVPAGFQRITRMVLPAGARILQEYGNHWQLVEWGGQRRVFNWWHGLYRVVAPPPPGYVQILPFPNADWTVIQGDGSGWEVVRDASGNTFTWNSWHGFLRDVPEASLGWVHQIPYQSPAVGEEVLYDDGELYVVNWKEGEPAKFVLRSEGLMLAQTFSPPGGVSPEPFSAKEMADLLNELAKLRGLNQKWTPFQVEEFLDHTTRFLILHKIGFPLSFANLQKLVHVGSKEGLTPNLLLPMRRDDLVKLWKKHYPGDKIPDEQPPAPPPPENDRIGGLNGFIVWDRAKKTLRWETEGPFWSYPGIDWIAPWNPPVPGTNHQGRTVKDELRRYYAELIGPQGTDASCGDDAIIYMYNRMDRATFWGLRMKMCPAAPENWRKPPEANYQQGMKTLAWAETNPFVDPAAGGAPLLYMEIFGGAGAENLPGPAPGIPG